MKFALLILATLAIIAWRKAARRARVARRAAMGRWEKVQAKAELT